MDPAGGDGDDAAGEVDAGGGGAVLPVAQAELAGPVRAPGVEGAVGGEGEGVGGSGGDGDDAAGEVDAGGGGAVLPVAQAELAVLVVAPGGEGAVGGEGEGVVPGGDGDDAAGEVDAREERRGRSGGRSGVCSEEVAKSVHRTPFR